MKNSKFKMQNSKLSKEEVRHIAKLAGLTLSDAEVKKFQSQLNEILSYVGQLKGVKTKNVESTSQVTGLENVFREDKSMPFSIKYKNFFKTKLVLEK